mmetsp:Transcript_5144/g.10660  ORF Transcript_5144/g.10660 Transcript_5144/m.10660 type:complete len:128 (+) Transcript_5144:406-789(+)
MLAPGNKVLSIVRATLHISLVLYIIGRRHYCARAPPSERHPLPDNIYFSSRARQGLCFPSCMAKVCSAQLVLLCLDAETSKHEHDAADLENLAVHPLQVPGASAKATKIANKQASQPQASRETGSAR